MRDKLHIIREEVLDRIEKADHANDLEEIRVKYLGKKGELTKILRGWGNCLLRSGRSWDSWQMKLDRQ